MSICYDLPMFPYYHLARLIVPPTRQFLVPNPVVCNYSLRNPGQLKTSGSGPLYKQIPPKNKKTITHNSVQTKPTKKYILIVNTNLNQLFYKIQTKVVAFNPHTQPVQLRNVFKEKYCLQIRFIEIRIIFFRTLKCYENIQFFILQKDSRKIIYSQNFIQNSQTHGPFSH